MYLIDSHCHLEMLDDPDGAVDRAHGAGVESIVTIGTDIASSWLAVDLAARFEGVYATVAVHPHETEGFDEATLGELELLAAAPRVVAVGECGLDFYRDLSPRDDQRRAFLAQIGLARRMKLPLVVHVREAGDEAMDILGREAQDMTVVMHCFSLPDRVDDCNERGYYMSFAGNVTYKNAQALREASARAREDRLLVETDAPFLTPVPHRGESNEPCRVVHTAAALAAARSWGPGRLADVTTANARRAFGLAGR